MASSNSPQLIAEAEAAIGRRDAEVALARLSLLEESDPLEGRWPRRAADVHAMRGDTGRQLEALERAVQRFARRGALLRAVATCKQMMMVAPQHPRTQACLAVIASPDVRGRPSEPAATPEAPAKEAWSAIQTGITLAAVSLAEAVQKTNPLADLPEDLEEEAVIEIPLAEPAAVRPESLDPSFPVTPLFSELHGPSFDLLVDRLRLIQLQRGQVLFRQGDAGHSMYVIAEGAVRIVLEHPRRSELARLDAGEFFGEIALITDRPRTATVEAAEETRLLEIDQKAISALLLAEPNALEVLLVFLRDRLVDLMLKTSPLFMHLSTEHARALTSRFKITEAKDGATLIEQGKEARGLMIILAGQAEVARRLDDLVIPIATLGPGDLLGEMSLLTQEPAAATVRAKGRFIALELRADRFHALLEDAPELRAQIEAVATQRRHRLEEMIGGGGAYTELHLDLLL